MAPAGACSLSSVEPSAGVVQQSWEEFTSDDRRIVLESGKLNYMGLSFSGECRGVPLKLDLAKQIGIRQYQGFSNRGQPIQTVSDIENLNLFVTATHRGGLVDLSMFGEARESQRSIRSSGNVSGYPEEFKRYFVGTSLDKQFSLANSLTLSLRAFLAAGKGTVLVDLPGADRTRLSLGQTVVRGGQLKFGYKAHQRDDSWSLNIVIDSTVETTGSGPVATVYQQSVPISAAFQPKTTLQTKTIGISLERFF